MSAAKPILIVDDDNDLRETLSEFLAMEPELTVVGAGTLAEAEAALNASDARIDAVLLDIGLPGQNGYEVARSLRGTTWGRDLLLVAITGWGQEEDKRRARESGFDIHLTKPVDPRALVDLLQDAPSHIPH